MNEPATIHRQFNKIMLIGAGGIGCNLAPMLCRLADLVIVDGDNYEPKNVSRQFPALTSKGNKAQILATMVGGTTVYNTTFHPEYAKAWDLAKFPVAQGVDLIFGAVDNNKSRRIIVEIAEEMKCPAILAGNDEIDGEAHLWMPGGYNCFENFPFEDNAPTPFACNADKMLEERPQTAIANIMAAGAAMQIYLSLRTVKAEENLIAYVRHDRMSTVCKRVRDFAQEQAADLGADRIASMEKAS